MYMKTMKNILYALFAVAALVMVGCTKDQTYTPGGDLSGEQIYIDNSLSTFEVKTAADKEKEAEELEKLSKGLMKNDVFTDDNCVDLKIVRKSSKLEEYAFEVKLTMDAEDAALFTLPAGATQTGANPTEETVTYTVPCVFDADASETVLRVGFDIAQLADNTNYQFVAELADAENSSNYGASEFEFAIVHSVTVELPYTDIGLVTLTDPIYTGATYSDCVIQIHNDDLKAINDAKENEAPKFEAGYIRFFIPRPWLQMASASVNAGDGNFEESDLEYFAMGDGLMVCLTPNYEPVVQDGNPVYPNPTNPSVVKTGYPRHPLVGIKSTDGSLRGIVGTAATERMFVARVPFVNGGYEYYFTMFMPSYGFGATTRTMNTYSFGTAAWEPFNTGSLYVLPFEVTWDKNNLEEDWANYFLIDYNNDIKYVEVGEGVFSSKYQDKFATKTLYTGFESVYKETVYYVADAYGTSTEQTGSLGLAMTWNGSVAKVVEKQPLNIQWNGRELYASQSENIKSAVELDESGAVKKLTFGVAIVNEDGQVLGEYEETFDMESDGNINYFIGEFMMQQQIFVNGSPCFNASLQQIAPGLIPYYGDVKITRSAENSNELIIEGLIPEAILAEYGKYKDEDGAGYFSAAVPMKEVADPENPEATIKVPVPLEERPALPNLAAGGSVKGTYDPVTNTVIIPAQYFYKPEYVVGGVTFFPYFQPCTTDYNYDYSDGSDPTTYYWYSFSDVLAESVALHLDRDQGIIYFGDSSTCPDPAYTFIVDLYAYDPAYDEFFFTEQSLFYPFAEPLMIGSGGGSVSPLSVAPKSSFQKTGALSSKSVSMGQKSERKELTRTPKAYPFR